MAVTAPTDICNLQAQFIHRGKVRSSFLTQIEQSGHYTLRFDDYPIFNEQRYGLRRLRPKERVPLASAKMPSYCKDHLWLSLLQSISHSEKTYMNSEKAFLYVERAFLYFNWALQGAAELCARLLPRGVTALRCELRSPRGVSVSLFVLLFGVPFLAAWTRQFRHPKTPSISTFLAGHLYNSKSTAHAQYIERAHRCVTAEAPVPRQSAPGPRAPVGSQTSLGWPRHPPIIVHPGTSAGVRGTGP